MVISPLAPALVARAGTKTIVTTGLIVMSAALFLLTGVDQTTAFFDIGWRLALVATGIALVMSPATESVMGSVPLARSGVGSAVNDTTREVGGAVGVAVVGSVFAAVYNAKITDALRGQPSAVVSAAKGSVAAALAVAARLPAAAGRTFSALAVQAFVDGFHGGLLVTAWVTLVGSIAVLIFLPQRPRAADVERQEREFEAEWSMAGVSPSAGDGHEPEPETGPPPTISHRRLHKPWHAKL